MTDESSVNSSMARLKNPTDGCRGDVEQNAGAVSLAGDARPLIFDASFPETATRTSCADEVETFYVQQHASLYRFLVASGCDPDDVPDLLQEGFVRLFQQLRAGRRIDAPRNWLIRVLQHLWYNQLRRRRCETSLDTAVEENLNQFPTSERESPELQLRFRQRMERLHLAVRQLTPTQHRYLVMRSEGLKLREIAELHGVTIATVAEVCARALARLRESVSE